MNITARSSKQVLVKGILLSASVFCSSSLVSCSLGPEFLRPEVPLSEQFSQPSVSSDSIANLKWWDLYTDSELQGLIRTALAENKDLQLALSRIAEARAILGFTRADQFPRLDASGEANRTDPSDELSLSGKPENTFGLFGDLFFEIDLWGKFRRATEAQRAELLSSEYAYRAVTISLVAQVATTYFTVLDLDNRYKIAQRTVENRRGATELIRTRYKGGIVPELDVNQATIEEAVALAQMASLERERRQTENALSVLLGRAPVSTLPRGAVLMQQALKADLPTGFPASLLERRPDIMVAEEAAHAETARIGVAEAQRFPALSLAGFIGLQSNDTSDFLSGDAVTWSVGGNVLSPLVDFGKNRSRVEFTEARAEQVMRSYEQTVLRAVQEVEDALVSVRTYHAEHSARIMQKDAAANATRLSRARYNDGVAPYLEVLDSERSLFDAELSESITLQSYLNSIVQLYKALGGGWTESVSS